MRSLAADRYGNPVVSMAASAAPGRGDLRRARAWPAPLVGACSCTDERRFGVVVCDLADAAGQAWPCVRRSGAAAREPCSQRESQLMIATDMLR